MGRRTAGRHCLIWVEQPVVDERLLRDARNKSILPCLLLANFAVSLLLAGFEIVTYGVCLTQGIPCY